MNYVKARRRLLAGTASGSSIVGVVFLPKCPLCFGMWLGTIGITGLSGGQMQSAITGLLVTLAAVLGWTACQADCKSPKD